MLLRTAMREEGLFRLAAAASVVKRLKTCLNQGAVDHGEFSMDPHAVAGALKCYLRELPEPLMTFELYSDWFTAVCSNYNNLRSVETTTTSGLFKLPPPARDGDPFHSEGRMNPANIGNTAGEFQNGR
uniref:Rho-GAP domain-containing protein n=1 Tax=Poecilia reticulata TaxID=8081 RepID=A0A3P9PU55_POERE